ncbi:MAG: EamA family transporter [Candidatus Moraniibacteriota bacterium]
MEIWNHWLLIAFIAPFLWALVSLLDVYFVEEAYEDAFDGALISGVFQLAPWLLVFFGVVSFVYPGHAAAVVAWFGGTLFLFSFFFYFKALFATNDVAITQVIWNLTILLVPFFSWLILRERLDLIHYVAVGIAFAGAMLLSLDKTLSTKEGFSRTVLMMLCAVIMLSLSMVAEGKAYRLTGDDFWSVFLLFSTGAASAAGLLFFLDTKKAIDRLRHIGKLGSQYLPIFILAESLSVIGTLTSQRAIDLSPSVSFVAVIESLVPVFVMLVSLLLVGIFYWTRKKTMQMLYQDQLSGLGIKVGASIIIGWSIYMIS